MGRFDRSRGEEKVEIKDDHPSVLSSTLSLIETEHARLRRKQRGIDKKDLNAALKYGTKAPHYWGGNRRNAVPGIFRYTYNDIIYIVDESNEQRREVTCYAKPLILDPAPVSSNDEKLHYEAKKNLQYDLYSWTSHTVMVIDISGSMRECDVWGARDRRFPPGQTASGP